MVPTIPSWFLARLKSYDAALRLRWSHEAKQFCLEHKITQTSDPELEELKKILHQRAGRPLKPPAIYIQEQVWAEILADRIRSLDELAAINNGYRFILYVPDPLNEERLHSILYTLTATDVWAAGGADKMADEQEYEGTLAERHRRRAYLSDQRDMAGDAYLRSQHKLGEIIVHPGLPGRDAGA